MDNRFTNISMNGRMAYMIMCVESALKKLYPDCDFSIVSNVLWKATNTNWADWPDLYSAYIPHVLFSYESYGDDLPEVMTEKTYNELNELYSSITDGQEDDPSDILDYLLTKPHEMAMVYEGTSIKDGHESIEIIHEVEQILNHHHIQLPDIHLLEFSDYTQLIGWGDPFDGTYLSIILTNEWES